MSWISKAENLLNKIDQSAANVLQQKDESAAGSMPAKSSTKLILSSSRPQKVSSTSSFRIENEDKWESKSDMSSISSKHETVIDNQSEDRRLTAGDGPLILKSSSSNASLINFSVEKELAASKILLAELRSENQELKGEVENLLHQMKTNGDAMKIQELDELCESLMSEKKSLNDM